MLALYGTTWWSCLAGPVAGTALHLLRLAVEKPSEDEDVQASDACASRALIPAHESATGRTPT